ncbi:uncharacterized protein LOC126377215 [Pectinophora gossypiella]|uniref:uncharacterized protein LOC126377215 n=1 Tax=Pectinophora gossypiella TaxID=13191 RepID=UPI00214E1058|nr:uncharacterized protein LOC126377215 [Pectinophora gossypiella]
MKIYTSDSEDYSKMQSNLIEREKQERLASAALTSETLSHLNISADSLPQRCQQLLKNASSLQLALHIESLDPVAISLRQSQELSQQMSNDYELMEMRQKNAELDIQIERNRKFIEGLKQELHNAKESLSNQNPNPENIEDHVRQIKQKLASYEEIYEKAKVKFSKLQVPDAILPKSIEELAGRLAVLKEEEENLRQRAEDITLARQARNTLNKLRRV